MQYGSGIISSLILTFYPNDTADPMMGVIAIFVIICAIIAFLKMKNIIVYKGESKGLKLSLCFHSLGYNNKAY